MTCGKDQTVRCFNELAFHSPVHMASSGNSDSFIGISFDSANVLLVVLACGMC